MIIFSIIISIIAICISIYLIQCFVNLCKSNEQQAIIQDEIHKELKELNRILKIGFNAIHNDNINQQNTSEE